MSVEEGVKVNLHQLLRAMIEKGASDMHITTGAPPLLRVDGSVVPNSHCSGVSMVDICNIGRRAAGLFILFNDWRDRYKQWDEPASIILSRFFEFGKL
jgi:hypothetical protein